MSSNLFGGLFSKKNKQPETPAGVTPPSPMAPPKPSAAPFRSNPTPTKPSPLTAAPPSNPDQTTQPINLPKAQGLRAVKPSVLRSGKSTQRIVLPGRATEAKPGAATPAAGQPSAGNISLPLGMIMRVMPAGALSVTIQQFEASPEADQEFSLPLNLILSQLSSGKIEILVQDLVPHLPKAYLKEGAELAPHLATPVNLPLADIYIRIPPDLLAVRTDQKPVDAAVINMADPFTEEILREQAAAAARKAEAEQAAQANIIEESAVKAEEEFVPTPPVPAPAPVLPPPPAPVVPPAAAIPAPVMPAPVVPPPAPAPVVPPAMEEVSSGGLTRKTQPIPTAPTPEADSDWTQSEEFKRLLEQAEAAVDEVPPTAPFGSEAPDAVAEVIPELPPEPEPIPELPPEPEVIKAEPPPVVVPPAPPAPVAPPLAAAPKPAMAFAKPPEPVVPPPVAAPKPSFNVSPPPPPLMPKPAPPEPIKAPAPVAPPVAAVIPPAPVVPPPAPPKIIPEPPAPVAPPAPPKAVETPAPVAAVEESAALDLNTCTEEELKKTAGCPASLAASIVQFRQVSGQFNVVEDLLKVPGITPATYALLTGLEAPVAKETLNELLGFPSDHDVTLKHVAERISSWPDVLGCVLGQADGLPLVGHVPPGVHMQSVIAFCPKIFSALNTSFREFAGKEADEIVLPISGLSYVFMRNGNLFMVTLSKQRQLPKRHMKILRKVLMSVAANRNY